MIIIKMIIIIMMEEAYSQSIKVNFNKYVNNK